MSRNLTKKQRKFADAYVETGKGNMAVIEAGYKVSTDESARAIASQNLTKPNVRQYLESKAERAGEIVFELAETAENEGVRLNASKDILDRAGFKPVDKVINVNVEAELDERERDFANKLLDQQRTA